MTQLVAKIKFLNEANFYDIIPGGYIKEERLITFLI